MLTNLNGRLPAEQRTSIGDGHSLRNDAAASYQRMREDGLPAGVTSSYRSWAQQAELRRRWLEREPGAAFAQPPGSSYHGEGLAVDLPAGGPREWAVKHAAPHGWRRTDPNEPWHFQYFPDLDTQEDRMPTPEQIAKAVWDHKVGGIPARERLVLISNRALKAQQNAARAVQDHADDQEVTP